MVNSNLQQVVGRWSESAEMSVFLDDAATDAQIQTVDDAIAQSGVAASRNRMTKADAIARFREDFPDLSAAADKLSRNPFPASIEVRLTSAAQASAASVEELAGKLSAMPPKLLSDDGRNIVIRPLAYCREADIAAYATERQFPIIPCNLCGSQEHLQRKQVRRMMEEWEKEHPGRSEVIFKALTNVAPSQLADRTLFDFAKLGGSSGEARNWLMPEEP